MNHSARRAAFSSVEETCPYVDEAFSNMVYDIKRMTIDELAGAEFDEAVEKCVDLVKVQTVALRDALIFAYEEKEELTDELKDKIYSLEQRIQEMENQIG
jgi:chaperonin cofactor prefoldin